MHALLGYDESFLGDSVMRFVEPFVRDQSRYVGSQLCVQKFGLRAFQAFVAQQLLQDHSPTIRWAETSSVPLDAVEHAQDVEALTRLLARAYVQRNASENRSGSTPMMDHLARLSRVSVNPFEKGDSERNDIKDLIHSLLLAVSSEACSMVQEPPKTRKDWGRDVLGKEHIKKGDYLWQLIEDHKNALGRSAEIFEY
jgi:hypothetical protein